MIGLPIVRLFVAWPKLHLRSDLGNKSFGPPEVRPYWFPQPMSPPLHPSQEGNLQPLHQAS